MAKAKKTETEKAPGALKWGIIVSGIIYTVLGVILLLFPDTSMDIICYIGGGASIAVGIFFALSYFFRNVEADYYRDDLVIGVIAIMVGCVMVFQTQKVQELIPMFFGIFVAVSGCRTIQDCVDMKRLGGSKWWILLIIGLVNLAVGVLLFFNPFGTMQTLLMVIGIGLIFSGITDIIITIVLTKRYKEFMEQHSPIESTGSFTDEPGWTCKCGQTGNLGTFCESCGSSKE